LQPRDASAMEIPTKLCYYPGDASRAPHFVLEEIAVSGQHTPQPRHSATP